MSTKNMTIDDVKNILIGAVAAEAGLAPQELATDRTFTSYGLDSMAALTVGMEIEDACGLVDPPVDLMWTHPTVDTLAEALWRLMNGEPVPVVQEGRS
ncbi:MULTISPECIES: acyl carrier protein [unclassified Streptomyces]|uniref:acyl carrier protein n=1 Tax=unclassified Streptomyces TaxID=2593676 RepID=UPI003BB68126